MPAFMVNPRSVQRPFHAGPYIQSGAGLFDFISVAARKLLPYIGVAGKAAASGLKTAAKSKITKKILKKGANAALQGGKQLLQGDTLSNVAKKTGDTITKNVSSEVTKIIDKQLSKPAKVVEQTQTPVLKSNKSKKTKLKKTPKRLSKIKNQPLF